MGAERHLKSRERRALPAFVIIIPSPQGWLQLRTGGLVAVSSAPAGRELPQARFQFKPRPRACFK